MPGSRPEDGGPTLRDYHSQDYYPCEPLPTVLGACYKADSYRFFTDFYRLFGLSSFFLPSSFPSVLFTQLVYRVYYSPVSLPSFYRFFGLSWEILLLLHVAVRTTTCFFFRNRPPGELDNKRSSTRRGEFDSSTPEAIGVLLG